MEETLIFGRTRWGSPLQMMLFRSSLMLTERWWISTRQRSEVLLFHPKWRRFSVGSPVQRFSGFLL
jgi:hypothetical protein